MTSSNSDWAIFFFWTYCLSARVHPVYVCVCVCVCMCVWMYSHFVFIRRCTNHLTSRLVNHSFKLRRQWWVLFEAKTLGVGWRRTSTVKHRSLSAFHQTCENTKQTRFKKKKKNIRRKLAIFFFILNVFFRVFLLCYMCVCGVLVLFARTYSGLGIIQYV